MKPLYRVSLIVLGGLLAYFYLNWLEKETTARQAAADRAQAVIDSLSGKEYLNRDGKKEAQDDIAQGHPKLKIYGRQRVDFNERAAIYKQRFGVALGPIAGCEVSDPLVKYADAYNAEVYRFIAAKFGPAAKDDADSTAQRLWELKQKEASLKTDEGTKP